MSELQVLLDDVCKLQNRLTDLAKDIDITRGQIRAAIEKQADEFRNCPSCGSLADVIPLTWGFQVKCRSPDCGMRGHKGASKVEAIQWWNSLQFHHR